MLSSETKAKTAPQQETGSSTSRPPQQHGILSVSAEEFVPRSVAEPQQQGRGHQGPRGRGRHDSGRGGLSRALQERGPRDQQHVSSGQQQQRGRGGSNASRQGPGTRQQLQQQGQAAASTQLKQQQQDQQDGSPERSSSSKTPQGSKGRHVAANHLLNFQYDSRSTRGGRGGGASSSSSAGGRRRYPVPRPQRYDKVKFLQANFRFLVSSSVDTRHFDSDADRMFDWDDVILVDMMSPTPIQCPISLESPPLCPQITPCGHVYSFGSIMQHLITHGGEQLRRSAPCPLCYQPVVARELRLVQMREVKVPTVGSTVTFQLLRRPKGSIIPTPVTSAPPAAADAATASGDPPAAAATAFSPGGTPSKWQSKKDSSSSSAAAAAAAGIAGDAAGKQMPPSTPLSDNLFAKFATITDPRPLWRAAAQELGQQLAAVLAQGGMEAEIEAPGLFAAADSLAQRARKFAEHQAQQLQQQSVPGASEPAAAEAAGSSSWPIWMQQDPQKAGQDAEQLVRDAFSLSLDGSKAAMAAAEQQQQVLQEFPTLASAAPAQSRNTPGPSAVKSPVAGAGPAVEAAAAAAVAPQRSSQQQRRRQRLPASPAASPAAAGGQDVGSADAAGEPEQQSSADLFFDHAFSEDEEESQQQQQQQEEGTGDDSAAGGGTELSTGEETGAGNAAAAAATGSQAAPSRAAASRAGSEQLFGTSPGTSLLLGSSPNTSQMNSASQSGDYYMYQAADGQWLFLHPLNLRCLLAAFGSYAACPPTVTGKLLEIEDMVQDDASRRRWKFLGHLPLQGTFCLGEVQLLNPTLNPEDLAPFAEELSAREKRRKRRADAARRESRREAAAAAAAQKARLGPTAAELKAMPKLGASSAEGSAAGVDVEGLAGLTVEQMDAAIAAQVMHDSAAIEGSSSSLLGASPPSGGVSFARIAQLGFAATGPALGGTSPGLGSGSGGLGPGGLDAGGAGGPGAVSGPAALKGAWGATSSSGKSAAARLSGQSGSGSSAAGKGATSGSGSSAPAALLGRSTWGASIAKASTAGSSSAAAGDGGTGSSASGSAANWLVLGKDGPGGGASAATAAAAAAAGDGEAGVGSEGVSGGPGGSSSKKSKKGMVLFATGQQRRY